MKNYSALCLLACATLFSSRAQADSFADYLSDDHLLYIESRDLPGYRERFAASPLGKALEGVDWKTFLLQILEMGRANLENPNQDSKESGPSAEDMRMLLTRIEENWRNISSHVNGDIAFAMGDFKAVVETFQKNARRRATLQQLDQVTEEDIDETETSVRLAQEAQLDGAELDSILSQFSLWFAVQNSAELATKIELIVSSLLQEQSESRLEVQQLDWANHTLYALTPAFSESRTGIYWAFYRDTWLITLNERSLQNHLAHVDQPPEFSLAKDAYFQEAVISIGGADGFFFLNPAEIDSVVRTSLSNKSDPSPLGLPSPESILNWLALDALLPFAIGTELRPDGIVQKSRMGFKRETALSRIAIDPNSTPAPVPAFLHRDFYQVGTTSWHIGDGWARLEQELMSLAPQAAAGLGMVRMLATSQLGFDLKLQFFDHLDSGIVIVQRLDPEVMQALAKAGRGEDPNAMVKVSMEHPTGGQNFLIGLQLRNKAAIEEAMQRLMNRSHPQGIPEPEIVAGISVHYPVPESLQGGTFRKAASFAITDDYFLLSIGTPDLLKKALLAQADENLQLRNLPAFVDLRAKFPAEAVSLEFSSHRLQEQSLKMMQVSIAMLQKDLPDLQVPDLQKLAHIIEKVLGVTIRKGLVFETESFMKFAE